MPFHQPDSIRYFTFDSLDVHRLKHAVFSRVGGVSPIPWDTLNVGGTVGDAPERVRANRSRIVRSLNVRYESLFDVWQIHSAHVMSAKAPRNPNSDYHKADAILTDQEKVTLFMRFADCVPILLYDPKKRVIGIIHSGWQGVVKHIARETVKALVECYGTNPGDLVAAIGPSIGPDHYQIGPEVSAQVESSYNEDASEILLVRDGSDGICTHLDLWKANAIDLQQSGVRNIEISEICTACHLVDWYSHREEGGRTGRFGVLFAL